MVKCNVLPTLDDDESCPDYLSPPESIIWILFDFIRKSVIQRKLASECRRRVAYVYFQPGRDERGEIGNDVMDPGSVEDNVDVLQSICSTPENTPPNTLYLFIDLRGYDKYIDLLLLLRVHVQNVMAYTRSTSSSLPSIDQCQTKKI